MTAFILWLFVALQLKHFIVDFPMQGPFQYRNKGTYGHPGGLFHALFHGLGTLIVFTLVNVAASHYALAAFSTKLVFIAASADMVIHYHIDWAKMSLNKKLGWGPTTHEEFWWLLGLDQLLHQLTYIGLIAYLIG